MDRLTDRRVLVVGASSGLGLAAAQAIAAEGAHTCFAARRRDRIEAAARAAGEKHLAVVCDVRDESSCRAAVARTVEAFGGLDAVVYAPGISSFCPIEEIDAATWREVLDTNLIGASLVLNSAIAHLDASAGKAVVMSSIVIDDRPPRPEQATYVVSKVALETLVQAWQGEHRRVSFTTMAIGDALSEFGVGLDPAKLAHIVERWSAEGYMYGRMMDAESVAAEVVNALASRETIRRIAITPRYQESESAE